MNKENNEQFWKYFDSLENRRLKLTDIERMADGNKKELAGVAHSYRKWLRIVDKKIHVRNTLHSCGLCKSFDKSDHCLSCPLKLEVASCGAYGNPWFEISEIMWSAFSCWTGLKRRDFTKSEQRSLEILSRKMLNTIKKCCSKYYGISFKNR